MINTFINTTLTIEEGKRFTELKPMNYQSHRCNMCETNYCKGVVKNISWVSGGFRGGHVKILKNV